MARILALPSWYGETNIDHKVFKTIREKTEKDETRSAFERVWTAIKDWFCGTKTGEAKEYLYRLYSTKTTDVEKEDAFIWLKSLCSDPYKNRFIRSDEVDGYSISITIGPAGAIFKHTIVTPRTEQNTIATPRTEQNTIATPGTEQNTIATPSTEQNTIATPGTEQNTIATPSTEQHTIEYDLVDYDPLGFAPLAQAESYESLFE